MSLPRLTEIASLIEKTSTTDKQAQADIRGRIDDVRRFLGRRAPEELTGCLEAAALLTSYYPHMSRGSSEEIQSMVLRLVRMVSDDFPEDDEGASQSSDGETAEDPSETSEKGLSRINDIMMGEILIQLGALNADQVDAAIKLQNSRGLKFGEALMEMGTVDQEEIDKALLIQSHLSHHVAPRAEPRPEKQAPPIEERTRQSLETINQLLLGEQLIRQCLINRSQLEQALYVQRATGVRIGEALVEIGATTWPQIRGALSVQAGDRSPRMGSVPTAEASPEPAQERIAPKRDDDDPAGPRMRAPISLDD